MLRRGEMTPYARARAGAHAHRVARLAGIAMADAGTPEDAAWVDAVADQDSFLGMLEGERIRDAFDAWG